MLSRIGLGDLIWPWMWPMHMMALGSRKQRIEHIPGASLAVAGGTTGEETDPTIRRIGITTYSVQLLGTLAALLTAILATSSRTQTAALLIAAALNGPVIIEGIGMIINLAIRPGQLILNHRRKQLAVGDQKVLILTSYVRDPAAPKGTAKRCSPDSSTNGRPKKSSSSATPPTRPCNSSTETSEPPATDAAAGE